MGTSVSPCHGSSVPRAARAADCMVDAHNSSLQPIRWKNVSAIVSGGKPIRSTMPGGIAGIWLPVKDWNISPMLVIKGPAVAVPAVTAAAAPACTAVASPSPSPPRRLRRPFPRPPCPLPPPPPIPVPVPVPAIPVSIAAPAVPAPASTAIAAAAITASAPTLLRPSPVTPTPEARACSTLLKRPMMSGVLPRTSTLSSTTPISPEARCSCWYFVIRRMENSVMSLEFTRAWSFCDKAKYDVLIPASADDTAVEVRNAGMVC